MKPCFRFLNNHIDADRVKKHLSPPIFVSSINDAYINYDVIDTKSGIYFIVSKNYKFIYPKGNSPLIYIGKADNLRRRLKEHLTNFRNATPKDSWIYSRYNYMNMPGGFEIYYLTSITNEKSKYLESRAIEDFYDRYLATPVGNGAFSFRKRY